MKHTRPPHDPVVATEHTGPVVNRSVPPLQSQTPLSRLVVLAVGLLFVALVLDAPVRDLARSLDPSIHHVLQYVTEVGNSTWAISIGLLALGLIEVTRRTRNGAVTADFTSVRSMLMLLVLSVVISGVIASVTKNIIGRMRPSTEADAMVFEFMLMAIRPSWASFPSGHATTAVATASVFALCYPRLAWGWAALGALGAASRALLGVHWLSDCIAGAGLGFAVTLLISRRMERAGHRFGVAPTALGRVLIDAVATSGSTAFSAVSRLLGRPPSKG